jgi:hypothetical protein
MRQGYQGVAVAAPVTCLRALLDPLCPLVAGQGSVEITRRSGLKKEAVDGLSVSSFTLAPDTAIGLTQHLGFRRAGSIMCPSAARAAWSRCDARRARSRR